MFSKSNGPKAVSQSTDEHAFLKLNIWEGRLRQVAVETVAPILPSHLRSDLQKASKLADQALAELSDIDPRTLHPAELKPARKTVGLAFVGLSAGGLLLLLLYQMAFEIGHSASLRAVHGWYWYVSFVSLGVSGLFMLGREAMRPPSPIEELEDVDVELQSLEETSASSPKIH